MKRPFVRMLRYVWPYKGRVALSFALAALVAALYCANIGAAYPFLKLLFSETGVHGWIRDNLRAAEAAGDWTRRDAWRWLEAVVPTDPWVVMQWLLVLLVVSNALKAVLAIAQEILVGSVMNRVTFDIRRDFFHRTLRLGLKHFSEQGTSDTMARFTNDVEAIGRGINTLFGKMVTEPLKMIVTLLAACLISWRLTLVALLLAPTAGVLIGTLGRLIKRASRRALESMASVYKVLQETFLGIKIVKAFTMERYERRRFFQELKRLYRRSMRMVRIDAASSPTIEFLGVTALALAMAGGGYLVLHGSTTVAGIRFSDRPLQAEELLTFYALLAAMVDPVRKLSNIYNRIKTASAGCERVLEFMARPAELAEDKGKAVLGRHRESVRFEAVHFSYDGTRPVLVDVNLEVRFGQTVALVGPSGSGKSTLVSLIPRFYEPCAGRILIDGTDIRQVRLRSLRRQIGLVTQEPILFDDTVANNIRYGDPQASLDQVMAAARAAYAHEFIMEMPAGYDTPIGELGAALSGGQRQRLTVARAILRDPAILILDEATSSLDSESERLLQKALEAFTRHRTTFVIAHRLSTIERADRIVVLHQGRVEAVGTHAELLDSSPFYRRLYEIQFGRARDRETEIIQPGR